MKKEAAYEVIKLDRFMLIDGNRNKPQWQKPATISIENVMGDRPGFFPQARAKMMYDADNLFVIFSVSDRYVRCITDKINGNVWEDSCVEFFFAPDTSYPLRYFNLEINCGGTALMHYNTVAGKEILPLATKDIQSIEIAHTLPEIIDPEITDPVEWVVEYRIPLEILGKYSNITRPGPGVTWKGNFYKIAENSSNPHYLTWSEVINEFPDFHKPKFFGELNFK